MFLLLIGCSSDNSKNTTNNTTFESNIVSELGEFIPTRNTYALVVPNNPNEIRQSFSLWKGHGNALRFVINYPNTLDNPNNTYQINNLKSATVPFTQGTCLLDKQFFSFTSGSIKVKLISTDKYEIEINVVAVNDSNEIININGWFKGVITEY